MAEEDVVANDDVFEEPSNPLTLEKKESEHEKEEEKEEEKPTTAAQSETARTEESTTREAEPLEAEEKPVNNSPKVPSSPIKSEPPKPAQRQFSQLSARSINVDNKKPPTLSRSVSNFSLANPHLTSVNDFKFIGDQFKVGKPNPAIKASHEVRFQKMWKPRQDKLTQSTIISSARQPLISPRKDVDIVSEFKRTKDPALLAHTYNANDFKHTGDQFKVGKFDPKLESPVEKRFKTSFKKRLEKLEPKWDEIKQWKVLTHRDMKEMHNQLAIK